MLINFSFIYVTEISKLDISKNNCQFRKNSYELSVKDATWTHVTKEQIPNGNTVLSHAFVLLKTGLRHFAGFTLNSLLICLYS